MVGNEEADMQGNLSLKTARGRAWWRGFWRGNCRAWPAWCLSALVVAAGATETPSPVRYAIHQPAQPLADALTAISRQTGRSLLFNPVLVDGRTARAISGQMSAEEAIARLLHGTGLVLEARAGALVVRAAPALTPAGGQPASSSLSPPTHFRRVAAAGAEQLAQVATPTVSDAGPAGAAGAAAGAPAEGPKVEVTGTRLKRVEGETALPVNVYTRAEIEKSGQSSLSQFLAGLNEVSMGQGEGAFSGTAQGQGTVQLRGLPLGSTLVLINGRRVHPVGNSNAAFFNLNLIPLAAVERVEVVPVGSSAVYGGDALAGVVNIILRESIDGLSMSANLSSGRGFGDGGIAIGAGQSGELGGWMVLASLAKATPLETSERAFFRDADYRRFGGVDARERACSPGTVTSTTSANLPGLDSTFAGIPTSTGPLTIQSFAATAGQANLCTAFTNASAASLLHATESMGVHASGHRLLSGSLTAFGELTLVHEETRADGLGLNLNNVLVPATNPHNPFGVPVRVTARLGPDNGHEAYTRQTDFLRLLTGLRGSIGTSWDFEGTASISRDKGQRLLWNNIAAPAARADALATTDLSLSLNPFTAGRAASDEVLDGIWSNHVRDTFGRKIVASGFARGPLIELPAGAVEAIIGGEVAGEDFRNLQVGVNTDASRRTRAVYGELRAPLWVTDAAGAEGAWTRAALTVAARRDAYSDAGSANTYQAGLELRPARALLLRASAATSFKPPTLFQTNIEEQLVPLVGLRMVDPLRGNEPVTGEGTRQSNKGLRPETGKAYALGAIWEPDATPGTRLGVTAWDVRIVDLIGFMVPQAIVSNESLFPGFITRAPMLQGVPGQITAMTLAETNFGFVQTQGLDLEVARSWRGPVGRWSLGASATRTMKYDVSIAPGLPVGERVGRRFGDHWAPKWKARLSVGFDSGAWSVGLTSRYLSSYKDLEPSDRSLGGQWMHDLSARLDLKSLGLELGAARAASLSMGIINLSNRLPEYASGSPYVDPSQGDWRGRFSSLRLSVDW